MSLRDFDRVRERRVLHVEHRHLAQAGVALAVVVGGAFYVGWHQGTRRRPTPRVTRVVVAAKSVTTAPLPLPRRLNDQRPPVLPTPVAPNARARVLAERRAVALAPVLEEAAERASLASARNEPPPHENLASVDTEHVRGGFGQTEQPPAMLGALPARAPARKRVTTKSLALREAFAERDDDRDGLNGEVPAEFVQSRAAMAGMASVDPALRGREDAPSFGLASGVDDRGAAVQTAIDAGGMSIGQPSDLLSVAPVDVAARDQLVRAHLAAVALERQRRDAEAAAAQRAAAQRAAAQLRDQQRIEAEAARAAKAAKAKAAAEQKSRKLAEIAATKAAKAKAAAAEKTRKLAQIAATKAAKLAAARRQRAAAEVRAAAAKRARDDHRAAVAKARDARRAKQAAAQRHASATPPTHPMTSDRLFWVQIKSLKDGDEAKAFADGLRQKGYKLTVTVAEVPKLGRFHRVRLGPFRGQATAQAARRRFRQREGMDPMVMSASPGR